nr:nicotinate-nucleotide adenylyltransferase [Beijerinckia indica]
MDKSVHELRPRQDKYLARVPPHGDGQSIGLFGGSFNPPHEAHRLASLIALRRLRLDRIWWLVSPGNPLKDHAGLPSVEARMRMAETVKQHPRIHVSGVEAGIGTAYTHETLRYLVRHYPKIHFVWIMGADNFRQFHLWRHWREIAHLLPMVIIDRPGSTLKASQAPAALALARYRRPENQCAGLARAKPPAFVFLHGPRSSLSSTLLRQQTKP